MLSLKCGEEMAGCCSTLFVDFTFQDLTSAKPPNDKGVYVIRVKRRSEVPLTVMIEKTRQLLSGIGWDLVAFKAAWRSHPQIPSFSILNILGFTFSVSSK